MNAVVAEASGLKRHYTVNRGLFRDAATVKALNGASFSLEAGKTLAVVGESGCGKSTLARLVTMIEEPTEGTLLIDGKPVQAGDPDLRRKVQIVFQNPYGSLNPRQKIGAILEEPLKINTGDSAETRRGKALAMMQRVGLRPEHYERYPHMFSGGQRQRVAIARALANDPALILADEPTGNLDSKNSQIVQEIFAKLVREEGRTVVAVTHEPGFAEATDRNIHLVDGRIDRDTKR